MYSAIYYLKKLSLQLYFPNYNYKIMDVYLNLLVGLLVLILPLYFYFFPVKQINATKGYRTKRSMKNEQSWDLAQKYWATVLLKFSSILIGFMIVLFFTIDRDISILITLFLWILILFISTFLVEEKLKIKFGN